VAARFGWGFEIWEESFVESGMLWEAGDALGAAAWIPPDGLENLDPAFVRTVDELAGDAEECQRFWTWMGSMRLQEPVWVLEHVGVDPDHQGGGIGSALVRLGLAGAGRGRWHPRVPPSGEPAKRPCYERLGFKVIAEADAPDGGPHIWCMRRGPRRATGS
jgi:GNAT superfamily N-acetyltransferase